MQRKKFEEEESKELEDTATFIIIMKRMCRVFVLKNSWCTFLWASNICCVWYIPVNLFIHLLRCNYLPTTVCTYNFLIDNLLDFMNVVDIKSALCWKSCNGYSVLRIWYLINKIRNIPILKANNYFILKGGCIHLGTPCHHSH